MSSVFIGIGSNIGDRHANIACAIELLCAHPGIKFIEESKWREYPALTLDSEPRPDFINGVIHVSTTLSPHDLLAVLNHIEEEMGRPKNHGRWQPRTIDLDILLYDNLAFTSETLTIPHPEMAKRIFVLEPMCDIAPDTIHPISHVRFLELYKRLMG